MLKHHHDLAAMPSCRHASAEISSHDVLMQSICCDHGKAMSSELPDDAMEDAEEAATTMSFYCNQWKAVKSELPWGAVEGDVVKHNDEILQDEDKASASELLWKAMELELPWGVVEEEEEEEEEQKKEEEVTDDDYDDDEILVDADKIAEIEMRRVRRGWLHAYGKGYGSFEDDTNVHPMRFTEGVIPRYASCETALQIFSVQVKEIKDGLEWPLHVHGHVAIRDSVDYNRNILFHRRRENCQILTQEDSYLLLTGPSRAVVLIDPVMFEVKLSIKGEREPEDKILSLDVFYHDVINSFHYNTFRIAKHCRTKRSTLEFIIAELLESVEATIDIVQVIDGSWPDHLRGKVVARTTSIGEQNIVLLDSRDRRMPVNSDGKIKLSRSVVSVDLKEKLEVGVSAAQDGDKSDAVVEDSVVFTAQKAARSRGICDLGFCKVEVTVAWSLLATLSDASCYSKKTLAHGTRAP